MKASAKTQQAHAEKIIAAVKVLMEHGLPDPVSSYFRDLDRQFDRPAREIDPSRITIPITQSEYRGCSVDLSATAPEKILVVMFNAAWQQGYKEGKHDAETGQVEALMEAFPKLKDTIKELAGEVADKAIDEFKERFQR